MSTSEQPFTVATTESRSAAERFIYIPELRSQFLRFLGPKELGRCMTGLGRNGMLDVIKELYRHVDSLLACAVVENKSDNPRIRLYCEAVIKINAYPFLLTEFMISHSPKHYAEYLSQSPVDRYGLRASSHPFGKPELLNNIIPLLQKSCPNLRTIKCGCDEWEVAIPSDYFNIHLYPQQSSGLLPMPHGHVDYVSRSETSNLFDTDSYYRRHNYDVISVDLYPVRYRFDLNMRYSSNGYYGQQYPEWRNAFLNGDHFDDLYRMVDFGQVEFSFDDMIILYQRQIKAGRMERLTYIKLPQIRSWGTADLENFASIASYSLVTLILTVKPEWLRNKDEMKGSSYVLFSDLPTILSTVHTHLPNLNVLHIGLHGIETAETILGEFLTEHTLGQAGSVNDLFIDTTSNYDTPLYNTIRCVSRICADDAKIDIHPWGNTQTWGSASQIIEHPPKSVNSKRRAELSTVDFISLGIIDPLDIANLAFDNDDKPLRALEGSATRWDERSQLAVQSSLSHHLPNYYNRLKEYEAASAQVRAISTGRISTSKDLLAESENLLKAAEATREAVIALQLINEVELQELRKYVQGARLSVMGTEP